MALVQPRVPMIEQDILGGCAWGRKACARLSGSYRCPERVSKRSTPW